MKTVFSGIQPSGELHLGNYLGAIRNWVALQDEYHCIYCVVDYHAITQSYDVGALGSRSFEMVIDLLALGVDPDRSLLFLQSMVPEHTELCWVFDAVAGFGDLERMTQFKDKAQDQAENINVGLFNYPVLQSADILLYKAHLVPVGEDQVQHIELARRISRSFNHRWGATFPECQPLLTHTPKLLGLDGKRKMSKSLNNAVSLSVAGDAAEMKKALKKAVTDEKRVMRTDPGDPDVCNVFTMHKFFSSAEAQAEIRTGCTTAALGCVDCKGKLAETTAAHFAEYRARKAELVAHPERVRAIIHAGAEKARAIARVTIDEVRAKLGLWR
jgi:tryptophanyl-tRNA synthetase